MFLGAPLVSSGSPFESVCTNQNDLLLWIPSIILAFINVRLIPVSDDILLFKALILSIL